MKWRNRKFKGIRLDNRGMAGNVYILLILVTAGLFILLAAEFLRFRLISNALRDATQAAAISLAAENWNNTYKTRREGYSGAYYGLGTGVWINNPEYYINSAEVAKRVAERVNAVYNNGFYENYGENGKPQMKFNIADVTIINTPITPGNANTNFEAILTIDLYIYYGFNWDIPPLHLKPLKCKVSYMPKF